MKKRRKRERGTDTEREGERLREREIGTERQRKREGKEKDRDGLTGEKEKAFFLISILLTTQYSVLIIINELLPTRALRFNEARTT